MVNETSDRPRLTPKGARTRARIVEEAAALIHERGVAGTTLEDVKVAAEVSGSQMYHYFPDKNELVQAVIDYQADTIVNHQRHTLSSANGVEAWRNMVITAAKRTKAKGGCPLGSLGGQLAESDPEARALIAAGFDQWAAAISDGLRSLHADGKLPSEGSLDSLAARTSASAKVLVTVPSIRSRCALHYSMLALRTQRPHKNAAPLPTGPTFGLLTEVGSGLSLVGPRLRGRSTSVSVPFVASSLGDQSVLGLVGL